MIQLNLLPDIKLTYIKAQRSRRLVVSVALLVSALSIAVLILLLGVNALQKKHLTDLNNDINSETNQLQNEPQILTALHADKPAASRLFDYLNEVTPAQVSITNFTIDFTQQTATITGTADALSSINTYVDTLKYTTYTSGTSSASSPAFSNVVLSNFGLNNSVTTQNTTQAASYTITLSYDRNIFDITQTIKLSVPSLVTTRSEIDQPTDLFKASSSTSSGEQ
jgi:hypothetical protein